MATKHTPGPWNIAPLWDKPLPDSAIIVQSSHGLKISTSQINHPDDLGEVLANARLIAAAPDLLAALTDIAQRLEAAFFGMRDYPTMKEARAAIRKATGEK